MQRAPSSQSQPATQGRFGLVRWVALVLLSLLVLVALAVLIVWLTVRPRSLVYSIDDASIQGFNLHYNRLNATFDFELRAYNPNSKVSIYYDKVEASVSYDDQTLAFETTEPFFQPRRNVTRLGLRFVSKDVPVFGSVGRDLRLEKHSGDVELDVRVKAKIRFKVGLWKSRHRKLRLLCGPLVAHFSSSKGFERTMCEVDL